MTLSRRGRRVLRRARTRAGRANRLLAKAERRVDPVLLRKALRNYRLAHVRLLPLVHPGFNPRR